MKHEESLTLAYTLEGGVSLQVRTPASEPIVVEALHEQ
jgi:hypothetical protein